jgi:putative spermidine/putrescine transport system substrate-binding protein
MRQALCLAMLCLALGGPAAAEDISLVTEKARAEGRLNLVGLSRDRCNYGGIVDAFAERFPEIAVSVTPAPDPADPLSALRGAVGEEAADVVLMDIVAADAARQAGLLQRFEPTELNELRDHNYDPDYHWGGVGFEVPAFAVNTDLVATVPKTWADLARPEYAGQIALGYDPAASSRGAALVTSAGADGASVGADAARRGLAFFAALQKSGNLLPAVGTAEGLADGTTPIVLFLDSDALKAREAIESRAEIEVSIPAPGLVPTIDTQAISATAPHPNAARLWLELLFLKGSQLELLRGYCHPIRWDDLYTWDQVPERLADLVPPGRFYMLAFFPSPADVAESRAVVRDGWAGTVGLDIR